MLLAFELVVNALAAALLVVLSSGWNCRRLADEGIGGGGGGGNAAAAAVTVAVAVAAVAAVDDDSIGLMSSLIKLLNELLRDETITWAPLE